jgi:hypothetical protein
MRTGTAVFLDTSIQIARFVHSPGAKRRIDARLQQYDLTVTSLVVRQEFKRRLLKEARYLLEQLERRRSFRAVMRHVLEVLPPQQSRKRQICLQTLQTIFENASDADCTDRARLFLRSLLKGGLDEFDQLVDHVIYSSGCECGRRSIRQTASGQFDVGTDRCSAVADTCGVAEFLGSRQDAVGKIRNHLGVVKDGGKSDEIRNAEQFLDATADGTRDVEQRDPCLTVGDLLIAIESDGVPNLYTMNGRESQHFCRALGQTMIVRKPNPDHDDIVCSSAAASWPDF